MAAITAFYEAFLRKVPRQSRSRSVVTAILQAATDRLSRRDDHDGLTMEEIASRAGVGIGSMYDYFDDQRSVLSAVAVKATADNLRAFEEVLARTDAMALPEAIGAIVDFCFDTYTSDGRFPRAILRIAARFGLMPTVINSQTLFAQSLAAALRKRGDVTIANVDVAACILTHSMMGVVHSIIWEDQPKYARSDLRSELVAMYAGYLRRG